MEGMAEEKGRERGMYQGGEDRCTAMEIYGEEGGISY